MIPCRPLATANVRAKPFIQPIEGYCDACSSMHRSSMDPFSLVLRPCFNYCQTRTGQPAGVSLLPDTLAYRPGQFSTLSATRFHPRSSLLMSKMSCLPACLLACSLFRRAALRACSYVHFAKHYEGGVITPAACLLCQLAARTKMMREMSQARIADLSLSSTASAKSHLDLL